MSTAFVEIQVRPVRRRHGRRRLTITARNGLRCSFTAGIPPDLAASLLRTALAWRGRSC